MLSQSTLPTLAPTTAELLAAFPRIFHQETVRLHQLFRVLGDRGLASALLLLTVPQLLPWPLGISNILALPILAVAIQMAMGRHTLWLPGWLLERPIRRERLLQACGRVVPLLRRLEIFVRPRVQAVLSPIGSRLVALACVLIAAISVAPLPLTGWLPAIALLIVALGMLERDGVVVLAGLAVGGVAIGVFVLVVTGLAHMGDAVEKVANGG